MINLLKRVAEFGVRPETSLEQAHHFKLTNVLLFFMFLASIGQTLLCFYTGAIDAALMNTSAPFVFGGGLLLMRAGYTIPARVLVVVISNTAGYAMVAAMGPETYFQLVYLFASGFGLVFFSVNEMKWRIIAVILPLLCFMTLEVSHYQTILGMQRAVFSAGHLLMMRVISISLIWSMFIFYFGYFIRDRRKSQEQLISSAKMVALGRMAAGIAHEVNNPLQLIVSQADRLKDVARDGSLAQISSMSDHIQAVAMRIAKINSGLLALSRDATNEPLSAVRVQTILMQALDFCRAHLESKNVDLRMKEFPLSWTVKGRETQLSQVVLNVLNNAYDAVQDQSKKWIEIEVTADKSSIQISITDSGPGIESSVVPRIFDPFFTTKPIGKGTGLGLSVSQSIIEAHGGQISYLPETSGARFVIQLPRGADIA